MADIEFTQGEDVELTLTVLDALEVPIDITGDSFYAKVKDIDDLETELGVFTFSIPVGTDGVVIFKMSSAVSLAIPASVQYTLDGQESETPARILAYDIFRLRVGDSTKRKLAFGLAKVFPAISL